MAGFPLYSPLICPLGWEPDFDAGSTPCTLHSGDVSRSRLSLGGTLFRSVDTAATADVNNIYLTLEVVAGTPVGDEVTYSVLLTIRSSMLGSPNAEITVSTTYVFDTNLSSCVGNSGVVNLRAALLAENTIITMPPIDIPTTWTDSTCHLTAFTETKMSGGQGLPIAAGSPVSLEAIRTGPTYTIYHVAFADTAEDGSQEEVNAISEWDGVNSQWIAHPSTLYEIDSGGNITPTPPCP